MQFPALYSFLSLPSSSNPASLFAPSALEAKSALLEAGDVGEDAGGSRAMMVLLVKQTHLQKEVGARFWGPGKLVKQMMRTGMTR